MTARLIRVAAIVCGLTCAAVPRAYAGDWLVTPFVGTMLKLDTNLVLVEPGAGSKKVTIGASGGFLTDGVLGVEVDSSYTFRPFKPDNPLTTVQHSAVGTLTGDVLIAVPRSITHESLRPYLAAGAGLMHVSVEDILAVQPVHRNLAAMDIGGGAIGFVNRRAGFRFDVRRFSSLTNEAALTPKFGGSQMSFWRLSVGVVIRY